MALWHLCWIVPLSFYIGAIFQFGRMYVQGRVSEEFIRSRGKRPWKEIWDEVWADAK